MELTVRRRCVAGVVVTTGPKRAEQKGDVSGELFQMMTGIKMVTVAYNGSPPALADLIAGRT
jgi:tripartite-type tricarboxylate transporter receptor subunit TctC